MGGLGFRVILHGIMEKKMESTGIIGVILGLQGNIGVVVKIMFFLGVP